MAKLILLRHLKSQWNLENRYSGWTDVPLAQVGIKDAQKRAKQVFATNIDEVFTSPLFRNMDTVARIFREGSKKYPIFIHRDGGKTQWWGDYFHGPAKHIPVYVTWKLNERYYGKLEGVNKKESKQEYSPAKIHFWRRSYDVAPPGGESLQDVYHRAIYFYSRYIKKDLEKGKNILIVSSHNPLRALVKRIEDISDVDIGSVEIDYGGILEYEFGRSGKVKNKIFSLR